MATYPCAAIFSNDTPADWGAHLIAVGADFFYEDNTSAQVGPTQVDVPGPNGSVSLSSPNPLKCVVKVLGAVTVKVQDENPQSFSKENQAPADQCFTQTNFVLAPQPSVASTAHKTGLKVKDVLHLK
jgi:hypothetical protein